MLRILENIKFPNDAVVVRIRNILNVKNNVWTSPKSQRYIITCIIPSTVGGYLIYGIRPY